LCNADGKPSATFQHAKEKAKGRSPKKYDSSHDVEKKRVGDSAEREMVLTALQKKALSFTKAVEEEKVCS